MNHKDKYKRGDRVFARVTGHQPWPAQVEKRLPGDREKYKVTFYGTCDWADVDVRQIFDYNDKNIGLFGSFMGKSVNYRRCFATAMDQIAENVMLFDEDCNYEMTKTESSDHEHQKPEENCGSTESGDDVESASSLSAPDSFFVKNEFEAHYEDMDYGEMREADDSASSSSRAIENELSFRTLSTDSSNLEMEDHGEMHGPDESTSSSSHAIENEPSLRTVSTDSNNSEMEDDNEPSAKKQSADADAGSENDREEVENSDAAVSPPDGQRNYNMQRGDAMSAVREAWATKIYSDVLIECKDGNIEAHKVFVSSSNAFRHLLARGNNQFNASSTLKIKVDYDVETFNLILEYLYLGSVNPQNRGALLNMVPATHKFEINDLKNQCFRLLVEDLTLENCGELVVLFHRFDAPNDIKRRLQEYLLSNQQLLKGTPEFNNWKGRFPAEFLSLIFDTFTD